MRKENIFVGLLLLFFIDFLEFAIGPIGNAIETIAFYNVENLFDPIDDPTSFDDDYTPKGRNHWTTNLLRQKINHLAEVIVQIGKKETGKPPLLIGLAEVENRAF